MKNLLRLLISLIVLTLAIPVYALDPYERERQRMVKYDLKGRDITDQQVLMTMGKVPRHLFVDESLRNMAYADHPLPIEEGQTISQPYIVALMTQVAGIKRGDKVLEIGTGSGYQAAILAELTDKVYTIEIRKGLAEKAKKTLDAIGYKNILVKEGDGYFGWKQYAPFDAIFVTAAANHIPPPLIEQLKEGGRLVIPLGSTTYFQTLTMITKQRSGELDVKHITSVAFVPMVGKMEIK